MGLFVLFHLYSLFELVNKGPSKRLNAKVRLVVTLVAIVWYSIVCFGAIKEKYCPLVSGCTVEIIKLLRFLATAILGFASIPQDSVCIALVIIIFVLLWAGVLLNSMIRLARHVYVENRS